MTAVTYFNLAHYKHSWHPKMNIAHGNASLALAGTLLVSSALMACGGQPEGSQSSTFSSGGMDGTGDGDGDEQENGNEQQSGDGDGDGDGGGTGDGDGGLKFDMASFPDVPNQGGPLIPETCAQSLAGESTVGCSFFGVDLDSHDQVEDSQFAIVVSNVQQAQEASVVVERKQAGVWTSVEGPVVVPALDLYAFHLPDMHHEGSGVMVGGAYRITSDVPIIAYQFNPIDGANSFLSDASMLYPVPAWDSINHALGWVSTFEGAYLQGAYVTIVAAVDGTQVDVTPSINFGGGGGLPASPAGVPFTIDLDEGDIAEVMSLVAEVGLTGTVVESDEDHPVAVFSGQECAYIPANLGSCDHLEEQISGVRLWGTHFIASRVPPRSEAPVDTSLWQIYASEDGTQITFDADPEVTGLPGAPFMLDAGEVAEMYVGGVGAVPGDFEVSADKPIALVNYMTGSLNPGASATGDPAMVQLSPVEQFLPRYVVLVPGTWQNDFAVISRPAGAVIELDGMAINDALFVPVADSGYEVARVPVVDGVHLFDGGDSPFSIVVLGYDSFDSYAYLGGTGTGIINPNPVG